MAGKDKVMHPSQPKREGGIKGVKRSTIEGPTHQPGKYNAYARNQKPGK